MYKKKPVYPQAGYYWIVNLWWICSVMQECWAIFERQNVILTLHCYLGTVLVTMKGDLKGYGTIWYHPNGIANILSLNNVRKKYHVTFDSGSTEEKGLVVHKDDGSKRIFRPSKKGLFISDITNDVGAIMVNTVDSNKSKYSIRQYSSAKKAHALQDVIGRPSTEDFIKYVKGNMIPNCNITRQDILRAEEIFGPNLGWTSGAIALWPTGNEQGGYYFLSLHSGKKLNRYAWTQLPMPNEIIAQVHWLAAATKKYDGIVFTDMNGNILKEQFNEEDTDTDENSIATEIAAEHTSYMEQHTTNQSNQMEKIALPLPNRKWKMVAIATQI